MTKILTTTAELDDFRQHLGQKTLGFVPTMGNLHAGHLSLLQIAQQHADVSMASIFVNPTQFGENEDLDAYPRTFEADYAQLQAAGVDAVFYPSEETLYPHGKDNTLSIELPAHMTNILCGLDRPTHFQGVATVVAKLLQLVKPTVAVFGEKDFQQLAIVRRLAEELFIPTDILSGKIVREADGLAMSSRNQYLDDKQRQQAVWLCKTLQTCRQRLLAGESVDAVLTAGKQQLNQHAIQVEYLNFRDADTLAEAPAELSRGILLVAGRLGRTRLIDNLRI